MGLCSLPVSWLAWGDPALESIGFYSRVIGELQEDICWDASPMTAAGSAPVYSRGRPLPTHASAEGPQTLTGRSASGPCGVTVPFSWVLACTKFCLYPPRVCFPQSYGSSVIKSCWPSKSDSLGIHSPWLDSQAEEPDVGPRTSTTVQELLWYYCSPVCELPTW